MHLFFYIITGLFYFTILSLLFIRLNNKLDNPVPNNWWITGAFTAKVLAGFAYGYIYAHVFDSGDSWVYFEESLIEYQKLLTHPVDFFTTGLSFKHIADVFSTADDAFWSNAGENIFIKLLALLNVLSFGNYYIDVILFNAFSFWGLYRLLLVAYQYITNSRVLVFVVVFFLPSALFWNSGLDKDGLILFFTGGLIYSVHYCITRQASTGRLIFCVIAFLSVLLLRSVNAVLLLPAIAAWWIAARFSVKAYTSFWVTYGLCILIFFLSVYFPPSFNLPLRLAEKQHQFLLLEANTVLPLTPLKPALMSYIAVLPQAFNHVFLRPYITELKGIFHVMAFAEIVIILMVLMLAVYFSGKQVLNQLAHPFFLFLLFVALSGLLLIGYTVPFPGAIVRYKAVYIIFLLIPFLEQIKSKSEIK